MKKVVFVVLIVVLVVIFGVIIIQLSSKTGKVVLSTGGLENPDNYGKIENNEKIEKESSEKVSGGSGGVDEGAENGGGGGGNAGGGGGTSGGATGKVTDTAPSTCDEQQISYAIRNFNFYSICNEYNENICTNKIVNCSAEVDNLDYGTSGDFEIEFTFFDENRNKIDTKSPSYLLEPRKSGIFEGIVELTSEEGNANKEISCSYATTKIPAKKVC